MLNEVGVPMDRGWPWAMTSCSSVQSKDFIKVPVWNMQIQCICHPTLLTSSGGRLKFFWARRASAWRLFSAASSLNEQAPRWAALKWKIVSGPNIELVPLKPIWCLQLFYWKNSLIFSAISLPVIFIRYFEYFWNLLFNRLLTSQLTPAVATKRII